MMAVIWGHPLSADSRGGATARPRGPRVVAHRSGVAAAGSPRERRRLSGREVVDNLRVDRRLRRRGVRHALVLHVHAPKSTSRVSLTSLLICGVPLLSVVVQRCAAARDDRGPPLPRTRRRGGRRRLSRGSGPGGGTFTWIAMMLLVCVGYTIGPMILATQLADVPGAVVTAGRRRGGPRLAALGAHALARTRLGRDVELCRHALGRLHRGGVHHLLRARQGGRVARARWS